MGSSLQKDHTFRNRQGNGQPGNPDAKRALVSSKRSMESLLGCRIFCFLRSAMFLALIHCAS